MQKTGVILIMKRSCTNCIPSVVKIGQGMYSVEWSQQSDDGRNYGMTAGPVKNIIPTTTSLCRVKLVILMTFTETQYALRQVLRSFLKKMHQH